MDQVLPEKAVPSLPAVEEALERGDFAEARRLGLLVEDAATSPSGRLAVHTALDRVRSDRLVVVLVAISLVFALATILLLHP